MVYASKDNPTQTNLSYVEKVRNVRSMVNPYIHIDTTSSYQDVALTTNLKDILDAKDMSYADKKNLLEGKVGDFVGKLRKEKETLEDKQKNITKYAYLPKEVSDIVLIDEAINSIEDSLFALEAIKFSSAVSVFVYLDSFTKNLSKTLHMTSDEVKENMQYISEKGEKNIKAYIEKCYLNPFETNYNCKVV